MNDLKLWFNRLQTREQRLLIIMSSIVLITLLYLLIWEPIFSNHKLQQERLISNKNILSWMQQAEKEVQTLKLSGNSIPSQYASQSINTLIERSAISAGIKSQITKLDTDGQLAVKVQFKAVEFDRLMQWLAKLQMSYGITAKSVSINRLEEVGMVACRVTLEKPAS